MTFEIRLMPARTLSWWRDERQDFDLEPIYQRKGQIWNRGQKQYLIDSILNGFDIPKLYVADFTYLNSETLNTGKKKYAVIDGKQRLLAIFDFFDDKFRLPRSFEFSEDLNIRIGGLNYAQITKRFPRVARKFDNYSLTVMSVITDEEASINELFVRLNSSKPLTGAELRNAMVGNFPVIIRNLTEHDFFKNKINFATIRSQDKNTAAKMLLLEHRGTIVDTKKGQLDALAEEEAGSEGLEKEINDELDEVLEETENSDLTGSAARMEKILGRMSAIFNDKDELLKQPAQILVIYWLLRDLPEELDGEVRNFLVAFEAERAANKELGDNSDFALAEYELMARTSNDARSIRYRTELLIERFKPLGSADDPSEQVVAE